MFFENRQHIKNNFCRPKLLCSARVNASPIRHSTDLSNRLRDCYRRVHLWKEKRFKTETNPSQFCCVMPKNRRICIPIFKCKNLPLIVDWVCNFQKIFDLEWLQVIHHLMCTNNCHWCSCDCVAFTTSHRVFCIRFNKPETNNQIWL